MGGSLIGLMRHAGWFLRSIASVVLVTFTSLIVTPAVLAAEQVVAQAEMQAQATANAKGNMGQMLVNVRDELRVLADRPDVLDRKPTPEQRKDAKDALKALRQELRALDQEVRAEFAANQKLITDKKLAAVIQERQDAAVAQYQAEYAALEQGLVAIEGKSDEVGARTLAVTVFERLSKQKLERSHQDFDPNDLPNKALKPDRTRLPKTEPIAWIQEGFVSTPQILVASTAPFDYSKLAGAGNPAYLAASTEVVLTDAIRAKADELGKDPVAIYHWVRNNVVWQPTWGAIQDAELTLSAQRGNAFDIASLTIALFRASGIPARYVHGTIDVPEDKFRSWLGGWQNLNPAIDIASAGGIPIQPITSGGRITKVRMEHIWVEAAIDFAPSRGAKNISADTWLALDPSFKQMAAVQGLDPVAMSGIDIEQLAGEYQATATVNSDSNWVSGFDPTLLQSAQQQAQSSISAHIQQSLPTATVGDVLGGLKIVTTESKTLAASMPNRVVAIGARYSTFASQLQQQVTLAFGRDVSGDLVSPVVFPWARVNGRQLTVSFAPATAADADALRSLLPAGGIANLSDLPTSIPAYLIRVKPELKLDGETVLVGSAITLGQELDYVSVVRPAERPELLKSYKVIAGSYLATSVIAGSLAQTRADSVADQLEAMASALESDDPNVRRAVTRDELLGLSYYALSLNYYAQFLSMADVMARRQGGGFSLIAGVSTFGFEPNVDSTFGVTRAIRAGGIVLNVPLVQVAQSDSPANQDTYDLRLRIGVIASMLEHLSPETMLSSDGAAVDAMSTVKAIGKAGAIGQKVFTVRLATEAVSLPQMNQSSMMLDEIRAAVRAGRDVLVHQAPISVPGWTGGGYVAIDPESGDSAFRISGGQNGGYAKHGSDAEAATTLAASTAGAVTMEDISDWVGENAGELIDGAKRLVKGARIFLNPVALFADLISCDQQQYVTTVLVTTILMALLTATLFTLMGPAALGPVIAIGLAISVFFSFAATEYCSNVEE